MGKAIEVIGRYLRRTLLVLLVITMVLFAIPTYDRFHYADRKPPPYVKTIDDFHNWQPAYTNSKKAAVSGSVFYIVQGEYSRVFASSKAEYYFDAKGVYINWNRDPGDFVTLPVIHDNSAKYSEIPIKEIGK